MDSRSISFSKALSWRVVAWSITALVSFGIVHDGQSALLLGTLDSLVKIGIYYGHERAWWLLANRVSFLGAGRHAGQATDSALAQHRVSVAKALSWRALAFTITVGVTVLLTGDLSRALTLGFFDSLIKIGAYYLHERAWLQLQRARISKPISAADPLSSSMPAEL